MAIKICGNTIIPNFAGCNITSGNISVGINNLSALTTGTGNVAVGTNSLVANTSGIGNIAVGYCALYNSNATGNNIAVGYCAGTALTTGVQNTIIGSVPGTAGMYCTVILGAGYCERLRVDSGGFCINGALYTGGTGINTVGTVTTGTWSGSIGAVSGATLTCLTAGNICGTLATAVTSSSLQSVGTITTGTWCSAIGVVNGTNITNLNAANLTGTLASAVTSSSLQSVGTITTGTWCGAFGSTSGATLTCLTAGNICGTLAAGVTSSSLTTVGTITTGTWCSSIGCVNGTNITNLNAANLTGTLASAVTSSSLTAVGTITTGTWCGKIGLNTYCSIGINGLNSSSTGTNNITIGYCSLIANTTGINNTGIGGYSLCSNTTGSNNTAIGTSAGSAITTGANNVIIGAYTGASAPISATGSNYIVLSDGAGNVRQVIDSSGNVGIGTSSPTQKLTISGNIQQINTGYIAQTDGTNIVYWTLNPFSIANSFGVGTAQAIPFIIGNINIVRMRIDSSGNTYIETGNLWQYAPAPTSISVATTLTAAQLQTTIINTTGTTYTVTLPLASAIDTAFAGVSTTNIGFDFYVVNTASGTITMAVNTGITAIGTLTILTGISAYFRLRRTAANTYILYRIG